MTTTTATPTQIAAVLRVPIEQVHAGRNARGVTGDVTELAVSIRALGLQKPLLVCVTGPDRYEIFDGHRRREACRLAGLSHVDIIVRRDPGDVLRIQQQLAMHAQARAFDPVAEAEAISVLVHEHKVRPELVARALGKSPAWVSSRLALLNLNDKERGEVREGRMTLQSAAAIVGQRRAERSGQPHRPPPPRVLNARHCRTCRCEGLP